MIILKRKYDPSEKEYYNRYGPHFNEKLCRWAVSLMYNPSNPAFLSQSYIDNLLDVYNIALTNNRLFDYLYIANMCNFDFMDSSITGEEQLIKYVKDVIDDPDGYEGQVFNRWKSDMEGKHIKIPWNDFL